MTESLYFEADSHRSLELDTLSAKLGIRVENLLTESLEMLLASYRQSQSGAEPIGLVADLHGGQGRIRTMIEELTLIRFMTGTVNLRGSGVRLLPSGDPEPVSSELTEPRVRGDKMR
jgi:hypothetical protein